MSDVNNNQNKDPIEELFERKAWDYDISYREADWLKLEKRLEKKERQLTSRRRLFYTVAAAMLLIAMMGYFTYQNHMQLNEINSMLERDQSLQSEMLEPGNGQDETSSADENGQADGVTDYAEDDQNFAQSQEALEAVTGDDEHGLSTDNITTIRSDNLFTGQMESSRPDNEAMGGLYREELNCKTCHISNSQSIPTLALKGKSVDSIIPVFYTSENKERVPSNQGIISSDLREKEPAESSEGISRLSIGILAGPDLSMAGSFTKLHDPGYSIGLLAEYQITDRLSIRTGIQRSKVRYMASGQDYHPPEGYWTGGIAANNIDARCLLLDIPLSLKYEVMQFRDSRLYLSGGFSSYIMLDERYRFDYQSGYGQDGLVQEWSESTGSRHWFSNASLSIGYEVMLARNWSLRAEPYLKLPVNGIGWGDVDLYAAGSIISFNYQFDGK